MTTRRSICY